MFLAVIESSFQGEIEILSEKVLSKKLLLLPIQLIRSKNQSSRSLPQNPDKILLPDS